MIPEGVIIHHSLTKDGKTVDWDAIKNYHVKVNKWNDIGYHAGVERIDGKLTILTGRPINVEGGHTKGHNNTVGICIVGNFDLAPPDDEMLRYSAILAAGYLRMFKLPVETLHMHGEFASYKSCPGTQFPWDLFKQYVKEAI